jgi:F-type H+-transporting ATPase subunit b
MRSTRRGLPRALAAAVALAAVALLAFGSPAASQEEGGEEETHELDHAVEECIHELEEANSIDVDCQEAPSPILPETNEILWGGFGFLVVFAFLFWKGTPAIKKTMDERTAKIRGDLESAEAQRVEAEKVLAGYNAQLADAKNESARIIEEARQTADSVRTERIAAIDGEIAEMRQRAAAEIESSKAQAMADLRGEVTALAIGAAERVVERNLDDATNRALVDAYIDQVGASS